MRIKDYITVIFLVLSDVIALILAFFFSYGIRTEVLPLLFSITAKGFFPVQHFYKFFPIIFIYILFFFYERIYFKRHTFWVEFLYIIRGLFISTILISLIVYFSRAERQFARTIIALMFISGIVFVPFFRYSLKLLLYKLRLYRRRIAIIGGKKSAKAVYNTLNEVWYLGYKPVGFIGQKRKKLGNGKFLGRINKLKQIAEKYNLEGAVIVEERFSKNKLNNIISECESIFPEIKLIPDALTLKAIGVHPEYVNEILLLNVPNNLTIPINRIYKRIFDFVVSLIVSLLLLPFFLIIGILIKLDSPGPVFFIQERIGYKGKLFKFIKFRTMFIDGDKRLQEFIKKHKWAQREWKRYQKLKKYDPRVTRVGRFLRRFSIDEMPQIFNILIGDMSIVGPRPYLPREKEIIGKYFSIFFKVKPGLTGLWQIRGRNELSFNMRLKLDEFYVRNWSFFLDLMIIFKTFEVVLAGKGAY